MPNEPNAPAVSTLMAAVMARYASAARNDDPVELPAEVMVFRIADAIVKSVEERLEKIEKRQSAVIQRLDWLMDRLEIPSSDRPE